MSAPPASGTPRPAPPTVALVPLRDPGEGKTRLAGSLSTADRAALAGAMLADVVTALRGAPLDRIVVAAGGAAAASAASALGIEAIADPPGTAGLDAALAAATCRLGHVEALLVVTADLPHLRADDVSRLLVTDAEVVVAPTVDGGTGALLRRPPDACPTAYGPGSAHRHLAAARAHGRSAREVVVPGFAHDVDVAADLRGLRGPDRPPLGARTAALLDRLGPVARTG